MHQSLLIRMVFWVLLSSLFLWPVSALRAAPKSKHLAKGGKGTTSKLSVATRSKNTKTPKEIKSTKVSLPQKSKSASSTPSPKPTSAQPPTKPTSLQPPTKPTSLQPPSKSVVSTGSAKALDVRNFTYNRSSASDLAVGAYHCFSLDRGFPKCGTLIDVKPNFAVLQSGQELIKLNFQDTTATEPKRGPASITTAEIKTNQSNALIGLGVDYIFPTLHYQFGLSNHFSISVKAILMEYELLPQQFLKGFGGFLTLNYYGTGQFSGVWWEGGVGRYSTQLSTPNSFSEKTVMAAIAHLGWRWRWESGMSMAFGAGAQYLFNIKTANDGKPTGDILPSLAIDLGYVF